MQQLLRCLRHISSCCSSNNSNSNLYYPVSIEIDMRNVVATTLKLLQMQQLLRCRNNIPHVDPLNSYSMITPKQFDVKMPLDVIGELWKTKAVEMMKGAEHASEKVLIGFCAFHHLLLAFTRTYPYGLFHTFSLPWLAIWWRLRRNECSPLSVRQTIEIRKRVLILEGSCRSFWSATSCGKTTSTLEECASRNSSQGTPRDNVTKRRNAMWILKQHPDLEDYTKDNGRIKKSWEPSQVSNAVSSRESLEDNALHRWRLRKMMIYGKWWSITERSRLFIGFLML